MKNGSKVHCLYEVEIFRRGRLVVVRITQFLVYDFYGTLVEHLPKSSRKKGVRYKKGQRKEVETGAKTELPSYQAVQDLASGCLGLLCELRDKLAG